MSLAILIVHANFIVKNCVEANILEVRDPLYVAQVLTIAIPEGKHGPSRAEHLLPEMREGMGRSVRVNADCNRLRIVLGIPGRNGQSRDRHEN
jgi:hypothetical protein